MAFNLQKNDSTTIFVRYFLHVWSSVGCADASETLVLTSTPGDEGNYTRDYALAVSDLMNSMINDT